MGGFKSIFVSSKHKIKCFLIQEKYFQTTNAVDTLPLNRHIVELAHLTHSPFIGKIPFLTLYDGASLLKPERAYADSAAILRWNLALLRSACTRYNYPGATSAGRSTDPAVRSPDMRLGLSRSWRAGRAGHVRPMPRWHSRELAIAEAPRHMPAVVCWLALRAPGAVLCG